MASKKKKAPEYTEAETIIDDRVKMLKPVATMADLASDARPGQYCMVEDKDAFYQFTDGAWIEADEDAL